MTPPPDTHWLMVLLALFSATGCSCGGWEVDQQITPWLRMESRSPYVDLPHAVEIGKHAERVSVLREGSWKPVESESNWLQAQPFDGGKRAIFGDGLDTRWRILSKDDGNPVELPAVCELGPLRTLADDELVCVACPRVPGGPSCEQFEMARFDKTGSRVAGEQLRLPREYDGCEVNQVTSFGLVGEHAAILIRLSCEGPTPARQGRQRGCAILAVEPGRLRTVLDLDQSEPCCPNGEWTQCLGSSNRYTPRYYE